MKLCIQGDTLRLRLSRSEVDAFTATGRIADTVHLGPGRGLTYALEAADTSVLRADLAEATLTVFVPRADAASWAESEQTGFEGTQDVGDNRKLAILIEKDFACLHRPSDGDTFPHPRADAE